MEERVRRDIAGASIKRDAGLSASREQWFKARPSQMLTAGGAADLPRAAEPVLAALPGGAAVDVAADGGARGAAAAGGEGRAGAAC